MCLAVVPAVELSLGFDWQTLGKIGGGGQDHHRFDPSTGLERVPIAGQLSVGCHLSAKATLTTKERALPEWRNAAGSGPKPEITQISPASKDRVASLAAAEGGHPKVGTPKVAGMGTPGAGGTPGSLTKWSSGDFFARISGGGGGAADSTGGDEKVGTPKVGTPASPSSPAFASRVSAAAAAAVADEANTPTLIVGPRALRWLRRFSKDLVSPSGAARRSWRTPAPGAPRRARHPLAKSIDRVVDEVSFDVACDNLRVAHPAETSFDPARGLTAQVTGLRAVARLAPAPPVRVSPYPPADGLIRAPRHEPSCRLDTLEVELEEVRVLLPPLGNDGEVLSPGGGGTTGRGSRGGAESGKVDSPGGTTPGEAVWRGFGTGDFDQEAEGYKAVIEMLEGRSAGGAAFGGGGSDSPGGDGSNSPGSSSNGPRAAGGFGRESRFARRRRETATDPALVLETRSVRLVRRVDSPAYLLELASDESRDGGKKRSQKRSVRRGREGGERTDGRERVEPLAARDGGVAPIVKGGFHAGRADPVDTRRVQGRAQAQPAEAFADVPQGARVAARRDDRPGDGVQNHSHSWRDRIWRKRRKRRKGERLGAARACRTTSVPRASPTPRTRRRGPSPRATRTWASDYSMTISTSSTTGCLARLLATQPNPPPTRKPPPASPPPVADRTSPGTAALCRPRKRAKGDAITRTRLISCRCCCRTKTVTKTLHRPTTNPRENPRASPSPRRVPSRTGARVRSFRRPWRSPRTRCRTTSRRTARRRRPNREGWKTETTRAHRRGW